MDIITETFVWYLTFSDDRRRRLLVISNIEDLIGFLQSFHSSWSDDPKPAPASIPDDLPPGLSRIYQEFGSLIELDQIEHDFRTPFSAQDGLMEVERLNRIDNMVEFAWENQGNWSCRFPLGQEDPPVYSNALDVWQEPARGFQVVCKSLNHFLITLCLQEAVMSAPVLISIRGTTAIEEVLSAPCEPLWLNGYYVDEEPSHNFHWVASEDILIMKWAGLWLASHSDAVEEIINAGVDYDRLH